MAKRKLTMMCEFPEDYSEKQHQICQLIHDNKTYKFVKRKNNGFGTTTSVIDNNNQFYMYEQMVNVNVEVLLTNSKLNNDFKLMVQIIEIDSKMFINASSTLKEDYNFVRQCMIIDINIFKYIIEEFKDNMSLVSMILKNSPELLKYASINIQIYCCQNNKSLVQYMSNEAKKICDNYSKYDTYFK